MILSLSTKDIIPTQLLEFIPTNSTYVRVVNFHMVLQFSVLIKYFTTSFIVSTFKSVFFMNILVSFQFTRKIKLSLAAWIITSVKLNSI